jgi:hypothetical protein
MEHTSPSVLRKLAEKCVALEARLAEVEHVQTNKPRKHYKTNAELIRTITSVVTIILQLTVLIILIRGR